MEQQQQQQRWQTASPQAVPGCWHLLRPLSRNGSITGPCPPPPCAPGTVPVPQPPHHLCCAAPLLLLAASPHLLLPPALLPGPQPPQWPWRLSCRRCNQGASTRACDVNSNMQCSRRWACHTSAAALPQAGAASIVQRRQPHFQQQQQRLRRRLRRRKLAPHLSRLTSMPSSRGRMACTHWPSTGHTCEARLVRVGVPGDSEQVAPLASPWRGSWGQGGAPLNKQCPCF